MRFRLVYNGTLRSAGNSSKGADARDIRDSFHDQLAYLWKTHRALHRLAWTARVPDKDHVGSFLGVSDSPFAPTGLPQYGMQKGFTDLTEDIALDGRLVKPLVRKSLDLTCSLNILFLRKEDPGSIVLQGGDLDGRIKTLFDALRMPTVDESKRYPSKHEKLYCLMESDTLISRFEVDADRLLFPTTEAPHEVHLVVEVSIDVHVVGKWNVCLLG